MTDKEKALKEKEKQHAKDQRNFNMGYVMAACVDYKRPVSEVAGKLGIPVSTIRAWKKKLEALKSKKTEA